MVFAYDKVICNRLKNAVGYFDYNQVLQCRVLSKNDRLCSGWEILLHSFLFLKREKTVRSYLLCFFFCT